MSRIAAAGFIAGLTMSVVYIAISRDPFPFFLPTWAAVIFYPGLLVGWWSWAFVEQNFHLNLPGLTYTAVGCIAEAIACAVFAVAVASILTFFRHRATAV